MANIVLIGMYDNWTLGLRTIANALKSRNHSVTLVHFKMPAMHNKPFFLKYTQQYQTLNTLHARDKVVVQWYNTDAVMWTHNEVHLLGDLLEKIQPDIIGISTRCVYHKNIFDLTAQMRRVEKAVTLAGGHDASFIPEKFVDHVDYVCVGEGERVMCDIADAVDRGTSLDGICNLVFKKNGSVVHNPSLLPDDNEDHFFREDFHLIPHYLIENNQILSVDYLFRNLSFPNNSKEYYTMLGRGCIGRCTFCSAGQFQRLHQDSGSVLKARRMRPIENVVREILHAKEAGFEKVYFLDSFFVAKKSYLMQFLSKYREACGLPFFAQLHPEQIIANPDILDAAIKAGMNETVVGIQSGSHRVNKEIFNRHTKPETILKFAEMCVAHGNMKVDYHIITHNPFEDDDDFKETIELIRKLPKKGTQLVLRPLYSFDNTNIHRMIREKKPQPIDIDMHYKLLLLYLIRYVAPDEIYKQVSSVFEKATVNDLSKLYEQLKKVCKSDTDWIFIGINHLKNNLTEKAGTAFKNALNIKPNSYEALKGMARVLWSQGAIAESERCLKRALKVYPLGDPNIWLNLGEISLKQGKLEESIHSYASARRTLSPYQKKIYRQINLNLGSLYAKNGQIGEAKQSYQEALHYSDGDERSHVEQMIAELSQNEIVHFIPSLYGVGKVESRSDESYPGC